ncbi:MAG: GNAT family N-acetyltransferase [Acidobacteria bacterium]|nr:GNAT family N-acetyltransferase [Acidobacteriota bacterium]
MSVTVRKATKADAAQIAKFAVALFELHAGWNPRRFTQIATVEGAEKFYSDRTESGSVLVAEIDNESVGFAYFEYEPTLYAELATRVAWLHDIYVDPVARRTGAGGALINGVRDAVASLGANKVLLSVAVQNEEGRRFFERNGFVTTMHEMMLGIENKNG